MARVSQNRFALEGLEGRNLLSASVAADLLSESLDTGVPAQYAASSTPSTLTTARVATGPVALVHAKVVVGTTPLLGAFNVAGTYTQPFSRNPDAGVSYHFTGSGRKRTLGSFTMTGGIAGRTDRLKPQGNLWIMRQGKLASVMFMVFSTDKWRSTLADFATGVVDADSSIEINRMSADTFVDPPNSGLKAMAKSVAGGKLLISLNSLLR